MYTLYFRGLGKMKEKEKPMKHYPTQSVHRYTPPESVQDGSESETSIFDDKTTFWCVLAGYGAVFAFLGYLNWIFASV